MAIAIDESLMSQSAKYADEIACNSGKTVQTELDEVKKPIYKIGVEEVIGETEGGKPIYRKRFVANNVSLSAMTLIDASINTSNVKCVLAFNGAVQTNDNNWMPFDDSTESTTRYNAKPYLMSNGLNLVISRYIVYAYSIEIIYLKNE